MQRSAAKTASRCFGADNAPFISRELSLAGLPFIKEGGLLVDLEKPALIGSHLCGKPTPTPMARNEEGGVVRGITRQLRQLRKARLMMRELATANSRKDEFIAELSHELRNSLCPIRFAAGMLPMETSTFPVVAKARIIIERQVAQMARLVEDLLDISRISNGRMRLQRERVDLRIIVNNAIETLAAELIERKHHRATEMPDVPVWLQADPGRLEQVFVNLVANASRYTDPGGEIRVSMQVSNGDAVVRVRDSGIGIASHALAHIFDIFMQANEGDPRSKAGLGVGLAVVRKLVELHGGSVSAASAGIGQGSEFIVRLPHCASD